MQETDTIEMRKRFIEYLELKELSNTSIKCYLIYWDKFDISNGFNNEYVNLFVKRYNNNPVCRAFITNIKDHLELNNIKLQRITGRKEKKMVKWLSFEDVKLVENAMNCERNKIMVALSFQCGLRLNELLSIKSGDFFISNWKKNPKKLCDLLIQGITSKSKCDRIVFVKPELMCRIFSYLISIRNKITINDAIFGLKRSRWQKLVEDAGYKALNKRINPHMFRHSLATHLIHKGMPIEKIKNILGHKSIATTQVYIHITQEDLKKDFDDVF